MSGGAVEVAAPPRDLQDTGSALFVRRLRARRREIEQAIFARVRDVGSAPPGDGNVEGAADGGSAEYPAGGESAEYLEGLRVAVAAAVDYALAGIDSMQAGEPIPVEAVTQARRAARGGTGLDTVLRRYVVGHALLLDFVVEEAERVMPGAGGARHLRALLHGQAALLDRLMVGVAREHAAETERAEHSHEHLRLGLVRALLAGEPVDSAELGYAFDLEHLGVIVRGPGAREALRGLAHRLDRRLLCVVRDEATVWGWLAGRRALRSGELERAASAEANHRGGVNTVRGREPPSAGISSAGISFAVGEPARGIEGWRLTHRQAQAALVVALRRPRPLTRYSEVALLAAALRDETLAGSLTHIYLSPLMGARKGGAVLRKTLHAYFAAERNASSAAAALGIARNTIESRLRAVEERLGRSLPSCAAELEVALQLDELHASAGSSVGRA
jgi:hypothetical protein